MGGREGEVEGAGIPAFGIPAARSAPHKSSLYDRIQKLRGLFAEFRRIETKTRILPKIVVFSLETDQYFIQKIAGDS